MLGGAERLLLDVAAGLPEPPELALPEGPLAEEARARGLGVFELRERSLVVRASTRDRVAAPLRLAGHAAELRALIASARPDAVIAWGMRAGLAMSAALAGGQPMPMMLHHHDLLPGPLVARAMRAAAARASLVVASVGVRGARPRSRGSTGRARSGWCDRASTWTASGRAGTRAPRAAPSGPARVLVLGAIEPWKRPDLALEATALAARELPGLRVRLVGRADRA